MSVKTWISIWPWEIEEMESTAIKSLIRCPWIGRFQEPRPSHGLCQTLLVSLYQPCRGCLIKCLLPVWEHVDYQLCKGACLTLRSTKGPVSSSLAFDVYGRYRSKCKHLLAGAVSRQGNFKDWCAACYVSLCIAAEQMQQNMCRYQG